MADSLLTEEGLLSAVCRLAAVETILNIKLKKKNKRRDFFTLLHEFASMHVNDIKGDSEKL